MLHVLCQTNTVAMITWLEAFDWVRGLAEEIGISEHVFIVDGKPQQRHLGVDNVERTCLQPEGIQAVIH